MIINNNNVQIKFKEKKKQHFIVLYLPKDGKKKRKLEQIERTDV